MEDAPSAAEGLELDNMIVEDTYDGFRLGNDITQEFIDDMIVRFKDGKKLHKKYVFQIILSVKAIITDEPTMVEMEIATGHKLTICGDTHGRFQYFRTLQINCNELMQQQGNSSTYLKSSD